MTKNLDEDDDTQQFPIVPLKFDGSTVRDPHPVLLEEATTKQILAELERRSLSCLACVVQLEGARGGPIDVWLFSVKGSWQMIAAMMREISNHVGSLFGR